MIFFSIKNSSSISSSWISIWSSGCSRNGLRREVWITLYRQIRSGVSISYLCKPTFRLTVKGPMYFKVSVRLFPNLIVKLRRSTSTLSPRLYDRTLSKLNLLHLSLICLRVLWMSLWIAVILSSHSSAAGLADRFSKTWIVLGSKP